MKNLQYHITVFLLCISLGLYANGTLSGVVLEEKSKAPIPYAAVSIVEQGLWTITDAKGAFLFKNIQDEKITIQITCLGFVDYLTTFENLTQAPKNKSYLLSRNNLQLEEIVVTAEKRENELTTSYIVDQNAMNHIQSSTVSDIMSQLPGGSTSDNQDLTSSQTIAIREESADLDNSTFGTAIEIDGIRLSGNSNFDDDESTSDGINGVDINNISTSNIESIEIVTGLPSVEYGDLTSGLVSIKTQKGRTPYSVKLTIKPLIKSYAVQKGFDLKNNGGTLNFSFDHTRSFKERSSPYQTYKRNSLNLVYKKEFDLLNNPLVMTSTLAGNIGGYNTEADPDLFTNTYEKQSDNTLRGGFNFNYLLNKQWITSIELKASANYSNKEKIENDQYLSSTSTAYIRSTETGYYIGTDYDDDPNAPIAVVPSTSSSYINRIVDNQPIDYTVALKGNWHHTFGTVNNGLKIGGEYRSSGNYGRGEYYADMRSTDEKYRAFEYNEQPFINNVAVYVEDKVSFPVLDRELQIQAGVRNDNTIIKNSEYGRVSSLSPRLNVKYALIDGSDGFVSKLSTHASIGDAVKLPSANILYPREKYADIQVFSGKSDSISNTSYPAYYTYVSDAIYNPDLKFQRVRKAELGVDIKTRIAKISVTAYRDKTFDPYTKTNIYSDYTYKFTDNTALDNLPISTSDQLYNIDQNTGIITVSDKSGTYSDQELAYTEKTTYLTNEFYTNGSSDIIKKGLDWVIDFNRIKALNSSIRLDGSYAYYRGVNETLVPGSYSGNGEDQQPYKYVGYYIGSNSSYNGKESKKLKTNATLITHIPQIRLIVTLRVEACLYNSSQYLSESSGDRRSYVIDDVSDNLASETNTDIYAGDQFVATAPLYYTSYEDPETQISFYEKLTWASENDQALYNDLVKLITRTSKSYYFNERKYSPYFSANLNITKEIGDKISLSFLANNFFNNMAQVTNSQSDTEESLYYNGYIPNLYYGLSLRVKL